MANLWENDPIIGMGAAKTNLWEHDPIIGEEKAPAKPVIDFNVPVDQVRKSILALPEADQDAAWDQYGDAYVAKERAAGFKPAPNAGKAALFGAGEFMDEAFAGIETIPNLVTGGKYGGSYSENLAVQRARERAAVADHPTLDTMNRLAVGSLGPAGLLKAGGTVLGNVARGAVGGAGIGAVSGFAAGEGGAENRLESGAEGAKFGATVGAVLPVGVAGAQRVVGSVRDAVSPTVARLMSGPSAAADVVLANKMKSAGITPDQVVDDLRGGQQTAKFKNSSANLPETIADTSHSMQRLTGSVYRAGGEAGDDVKGFLEGRQRGPANRFDPQPGEMPGQLADVEDAVARSMSVKSAKSAYRTEQDIVDKARSEAGKSYTAAYKGSEDFDLQPAIDGLALKAQQYTGPFRQKLLGAMDLFSDPMKPGQRWSVNNVTRFDNAKKQLDDMIEASKETGRATNMTRELTDFKHALLHRVHEPNAQGMPTKNVLYQKARDEFGSNAEAREAIDLGRRALRENTDVTLDQFKALTPGQKKLARIGVMDAIRSRNAGKKPGDNAALSLQDRRVTEILNELVPGKQAAKLGDYLRRQERMSETRGVATGGSQTARNLEDDADTAAQTFSTMWNRWRSSPGIMNMGIEAVSAVASKMFGYNQQVAKELAIRLLATKPAEQRYYMNRIKAQFGPQKYAEFTANLGNIGGSLTQYGAAENARDDLNHPEPTQLPAPAQPSGDGRQALPAALPPNSDGSVLKEGPKPTFRDKAADFLGSIHGGDATHKNANYTAVDALSLIPPVGAIVGIDEARHMSDEGSPVAAAGLGILSLLPGGRGAKKGAEEALGAITREIESLTPRYRELFGRAYVSPKAPAGAPMDDVIRGEQQTLDELRSAISRKEGDLSSRPVSSTPKIARDYGDEQQAELLNGLRENPYVQAIPGRQGLPSKRDQEAFVRQFFDAGNRLPAGPWGRGISEDVQRAIVEGFQSRSGMPAPNDLRRAFIEARQEIEQLKSLKDGASGAELEAVKAELREANQRAVYYQQMFNKATDIINGALKKKD